MAVHTTTTAVNEPLAKADIDIAALLGKKVALFSPPRESPVRRRQGGQVRVPHQQRRPEVAREFDVGHWPKPAAASRPSRVPSLTVVSGQSAQWPSHRGVLRVLWRHIIESLGPVMGATGVTFCMEVEMARKDARPEVSRRKFLAGVAVTGAAATATTG